MIEHEESPNIGIQYLSDINDKDAKEIMKKILLLSGSLVFLSGCSMMNSIWTNSPNHANVSKEQNVNSNTIQSKETNASGAFYENKSGHDSWRMQY